MGAIKKADAKLYEKAWKTLREDGNYVEAGENDNVIVQKLEANKNAYGVFGYSFLEENAAKLKGVPFDGTDADVRDDRVGQVRRRASAVHLHQAAHRHRAGPRQVRG